VVVLHGVFRFAQICLECSLAVTSSERIAVRRDNHLDQPTCGPVVRRKISKDCLKVITDLHGPKLPDGVLPKLVKFTNTEVSAVIQFHSHSLV
jgi:hypothetical protein